jgi:hypothetical protein
LPNTGSPATVGAAWLPKEFSFLAGLPEDKRRRRPILTIQAYFDDSGVMGTHPVFTFAGFMGRAEQWAEFSGRWSDWLALSPSIKYLKMSEAADLDGEFRFWRADARDKKLHGCIDILKAFNPQLAIQISVHVEDFVNHLRAEMPPRLANPYMLAFWGILSAACYELIDSGSPEPIEIIFDDHVIFRPRIDAWYPWIRDKIGAFHDPELASVLPPNPIFKNDVEFVPLQASDVLAWLFREAYSRNRNEFEWIAEELIPLIPMSKYATFYNAERMGNVQSLTDEIFKRITPEHMKDFLRVVGMKNIGRSKKRRTK